MRACRWFFAGDVNLVTACYWCNQLKSSRRNEGLGWRLAPEPRRGTWDGLALFLDPLLELLWARIPERNRPYYAKWRQAVGTGKTIRLSSASLDRREIPSRSESKSQLTATRSRPASEGTVVRGVRKGRIQTRNYRVESSKGGQLTAREFWFRERDDVCIYSPHAVELEPGAEVQSGRAPEEGIPISAQSRGTYLPPGR